MCDEVQSNNCLLSCIHIIMLSLHVGLTDSKFTGRTVFDTRFTGRTPSLILVLHVGLSFTASETSHPD